MLGSTGRPQADAACARHTTANPPPPTPAQEPEKAVRAFEWALEADPKNAALALKCGDALAAAHDYARAADYYSRAARADPSQARRLAGTVCFRAAAHI